MKLTNKQLEVLTTQIWNELQPILIKAKEEYEEKVKAEVAHEWKAREQTHQAKKLKEVFEAANKFLEYKVRLNIKYNELVLGLTPENNHYCNPYKTFDDWSDMKKHFFIDRTSQLNRDYEAAINYNDVQSRVILATIDDPVSASKMVENLVKEFTSKL